MKTTSPPEREAREPGGFSRRVFPCPHRIALRPRRPEKASRPDRPAGKPPARACCLPPTPTQSFSREEETGAWERGWGARQRHRWALHGRQRVVANGELCFRAEGEIGVRR
ncbi:hypothetical protein Pden_0124 [Paracoccus denitrificans PD1222]|uniref:Uncharacterized protein n=1 Tax=Paracoccus denitrificans (strain Pd 1222) TaxID=318586 RepID=A1AY97_PARDP|nr:hypothetical protein Pden_0124 [Paracoccus denitrificans PD1222]